MAHRYQGGSLTGSLIRYPGLSQNTIWECQAFVAVSERLTNAQGVTQIKMTCSLFEYISSSYACCGSSNAGHYVDDHRPTRLLPRRHPNQTLQFSGIDEQQYCFARLWSYAREYEEQ